MSLLTVDSVGRLMACWDGTTCEEEVPCGWEVEQRNIPIPSYKRKGILGRIEESKGIAGIPGNSEEIWILATVVNVNSLSLTGYSCASISGTIACGELRADVCEDEI
eukprot:scaffold9876_cov77-Cyclotella_meneghiniana.AAC.5